MRQATAIVSAAVFSIALAACGDDQAPQSDRSNTSPASAPTAAAPSAAAAPKGASPQQQLAAEKERIALLALGVDGVRSVVNNLIVLRGS